MPESWNPPNDFNETQLGDEYVEFKHLMLKFWDKNLDYCFGFYLFALLTLFQENIKRHQSNFDNFCRANNNNGKKRFKI